MEILAFKDTQGGKTVLYRKDNKFFLETVSIFDTDVIPVMEEISVRQAKSLFKTMVQIQTAKFAFRET